MLVFVSHCSKDKPAVRRIAEGLRCDGIQVWLDEAEIRVGDSISGSIDEALSNSDALLLVYSAHAAVSPWVGRELNSFVTRMIEEEKPILPCRLDLTAMPSLIRDLRYADFSDSFDDGMAQLKGALRLGDEIELNGAVVEAHRELVDSSEFDVDDLKWVLLHLGPRSSGQWFCGDRREVEAPWSLLSRLGSLGIAERSADRYEVGYDITELGRRVLLLLAETIPDDADEALYPAFRRRY